MEKKNSRSNLELGYVKKKLLQYQHNIGEMIRFCKL